MILRIKEIRRIPLSFQPILLLRPIVLPLSWRLCILLFRSIVFSLFFTNLSICWALMESFVHDVKTTMSMMLHKEREAMLIHKLILWELHSILKQISFKFGYWKMAIEGNTLSYFLCFFSPFSCFILLYSLCFHKALPLLGAVEAFLA